AHRSRHGLDGPDVRRILVEREMRASPVIAGDSTTQKSRSLLRTCDHRAEIFSGSGPPGSITWRRTEFWRRTRARSTTGWREQRQPLHTDSRNVDALRRLVYTARRATAGGPAGRMSEMVLPHELRAGDVVELAGSAWRVVHQPRTRAGVKSLEVALEHVAHRDEWLIWPLDQHRPVKRITETEASSTRG